MSNKDVKDVAKKKVTLKHWWNAWIDMIGHSKLLAFL